MVAGALYCSADDPLLRKMHVYALEQVKKYNNLKINTLLMQEQLMQGTAQ